MELPVGSSDNGRVAADRNTSSKPVVLCRARLRKFLLLDPDWINRDRIGRLLVVDGNRNIVTDGYHTGGQRATVSIPNFERSVGKDVLADTNFDGAIGQHSGLAGAG